MTRIAIIEYHENTAKQVVTHAADSTDADMLAYATSTFQLHKIKSITTVTVDAVYSNVSPITTWLKTTKRLTT